MTDQGLLFDPGPPSKIPANPCTPARPGTGPEGAACKTCRHLARQKLANTYIKCGLMRHCWTHGGATDIRAWWPACRFYEEQT